jgi:hypothetical protein
VARTACPERRSLTSPTNRCWPHGGPNGLDRDPPAPFRARSHQRAEAPDLVTSCPVARRQSCRSLVISVRRAFDRDDETELIIDLTATDIQASE